MARTDGGGGWCIPVYFPGLSWFEPRKFSHPGHPLRPGQTWVTGRPSRPAGQGQLGSEAAWGRGRP